MYDELILKLREDAEFLKISSRYNNTKNEFAERISQAANAIEELSAKQTPMKVAEIHVDEYFCPSCGAENNCDQGYVQDAYCPVCGQRLLAAPPKEETDG